MRIFIYCIVGLLVLGVLTGCQQTPTEVTYREVSIGNLKIDVPTDWQRPDNIEDMVDEVIDAMGSGTEQYVQVDGYESSTSEDIYLVALVMEVGKMFEEEGMIWEDWDSLFEEGGMTKEGFLSLMSLGLLMEGAEELTQENIIQHTINDCEALESIITCMVDGKDAKAHILMILGDSNLGLIMLGGNMDDCEKFENSWKTMRDSVTL